MKEKIWTAGGSVKWSRRGGTSQNNAYQPTFYNLIINSRLKYEDVTLLIAHDHFSPINLYCFSTYNVRTVTSVKYFPLIIYKLYLKL